MAKKKKTSVYKMNKFLLGRGFGFASLEGDDEVFVHRSELPAGVQDEIKALEDKLDSLEITGNIEQTDKGIQLVGCELA